MPQRGQAPKFNYTVLQFPAFWGEFTGKAATHCPPGAFDEIIFPGACNQWGDSHERPFYSRKSSASFEFAQGYDLQKMQNSDSGG